MFAATSNGGSAVGGLVFLVFLVVGAALYFLPSILALMRKVPNVGSVIVINVFLGWTFIGWIVALAMAMRSRPVATNVYVNNAGMPMQPGMPLGFVPMAPGAPPVPQPPTASGPAGWHPDPHGAARLRYFDGTAWTSHTHD